MILLSQHAIKQEFTTADSLQFNGVAEHALGLIETAAVAGRMQARKCRQRNRCGPKRRTGRAMLLNRAAMSANPENKSPYDMWYVKTPSVVLLPFLTSGNCKTKKVKKSRAKAQGCFILGPAPDHPQDTVRVLTKHHTLLITRHVTWQRVSPAPPVPAQKHGSLSQEAGRSEADDENTSDRGWGGGGGRAGRWCGFSERPRRDVGV